MTLGTIKGLYRYPVKSMMGGSHDQLELRENGVPGDRAWAVRDERRGGIRGAKRFAPLMQCSARYLKPPAEQGSSPAEITLPSGEIIKTGDRNASLKLSKFLKGPVTLWPLMPKDALDHYRRGAPLLNDKNAEMRRIFGRTDDEDIPDLSVFPAELMEYETPLGTYFDAYSLLVLTEQSLKSMTELSPDHNFDVRRFRPNILLDSVEKNGFPEEDWVGKVAKIGTALIKFEIKAPRCVMVTHGFSNLPKDPGIMRSLVKNVGGNLGIYASVIKNGTINVGDKINMVD